MSGAPRRTPDCSHTNQTVEARAAQQIDENGLGAIVSGVSRTHVVGECGIARRAGSSLDIGTLFDANGTRCELCSDGARCSRDGVGFQVRSVPETVIDVYCCDLESCSACECEQCQRVRSAGYGTGDS